MARRTKQGVEAFRWALPSSEQVAEALAYFYTRPRPPSKSTLIFKQHNPSPWKVHRQIEAYLYGMDLLEKILDRWEEDWQRPRTDGALAYLLSIQHKGRYKSSTFTEVIRKSFPQANDDPFLSRYHDSICREAAQRITGWVQSIIKLAITVHREQQKQPRQMQAFGDDAKHVEMVTSDTKPPKYVPTLSDVYQIWAEREQAYQQAAASIIPFGRNIDRPLVEHGKREARWLLDRLLPEEEIADLLTEVERLLDEEPSMMQGDAAFVEHPWQRNEPNKQGNQRHRRSIRESRLMQRVLDPPGDLVLLGTFHKNELATFRSELRERQKNVAGFKASLLHLEAALAEAQEVKIELTNLQDALEIFLYGKPDPYPTVEGGEWSEEYRKRLQNTYETWLGWFALNRDKPEQVERFLNEQLEVISRNGMLKAASALTPPKWSPLSFIGAMRPGQYRDFALLYDRETYRYTLAIVVHKPGTFGSNQAFHRREETAGGRKEEQQRYQQRRTANPLYYVNFPETPFAPPKGTSVLLFRLECIQEYQGVVLKEVIKRQRKAQRQAYRNLNGADTREIPLEKSPLDATLKSAKLLCAWDQDNIPSFSVHIKLEMPPADSQPSSTRVIGFHEHDEGYSYAVLDLDGTVQKVGDLRLDRHVNPAHGAPANGDNYIYHVAHAVLGKAWVWNAHIGLEDTLWKKERPTLSRAHNRETFSRPSQFIIETVKDKAAAEGLLAPRTIGNISPARDCAACRTRPGGGIHGISREQIVGCPSCRRQQRLDNNSESCRCIECGHAWQPPKDQIKVDHLFACPSCQAPALLARYNTAIVVAQRTLCELVRHHEHALAFEKRQGTEVKTKE
jgi:hypothetical protein